VEDGLISQRQIRLFMAMTTGHLITKAHSDGKLWEGIVLRGRWYWRLICWRTAL